MKYLFVLLFILNISALPQVILKGKVLNRENTEPLNGATVAVQNKTFGAITDNSGSYTLKGDIIEGDVITISYVGFTPANIVYSTELQKVEEIITSLTPAIIPSQSVLVEAALGKEGFTPLTFEKVKREKIRNEYSVQDVPQFLGDLPSVTTYSESGNGLGYNYLSIRGFDQRRISVSINGIPQNDPEDHNVYWLDFPDLIESTELIQVQRGAGSGVFGYPAIGGSINIITSNFSNTQHVSLSSSLGSYNTRKYAVNYSTGLLNNKYSLYVKLSSILSSGYRDQSWINYKAYHLSAVRYDENLTTQVNVFGGPIEDGLAYTGLPKFAIKDKELRKRNFSYWEASGNSLGYVSPRRPQEVENFFQPHFELLNEYRLNQSIVFNSALFYVRGKGFFDFDGSWADTTYLRLTTDKGFNTSSNPSDAIIRAWVSNNQYGWLPRLSIDHTSGKFIAGGEIRFHRSEHWGEIKSANDLPAGFNNSYRYYSYNGGKDIYSFFVNESYTFSEQFNILAEAQLVFNKYKLYNEKYIGTDLTVKNTFLNTRFGLNYKYSMDNNFYVTFSRVSREPRLSNYYDAAESSGGTTPKFEQNESGVFDFNNPLVNPETMNDLELGANVQFDNLSLSLNAYYMSFDDEIVKNGMLDRFGQPYTGNVKNTLHKGIEFTAQYKLPFGFDIHGNLTYGSNLIKEGKFYIDSTKAIDLSGNRISGFPDFMTSFGASYNTSMFYFKLTCKYVGRFYSDNYDSKLTQYQQQYSEDFVTYTDNKNDPYFNADFLASYKFNLFSSFYESRVFFMVNNIFNRLYSANAIGGEFFPAAERNFLVGIKVGI